MSIPRCSYGNDNESRFALYHVVVGCAFISWEVSVTVNLLTNYNLQLLSDVIIVYLH